LIRLLLLGAERDSKEDPVPDLSRHFRMAFRLSLQSGNSRFDRGRVMRDTVRSGLG